MNRRQLEHVIRAAAATADVVDIVVIGSQAILGSHPNAPPELTESMEADVFPKAAPERSIVIDGAIGEMSMFHDTFGYYAHGVDDTTAVLPSEWQDRLVRVESRAMGDAVGWCLDAHDLAVAKLAAAREKDFKFVRAMIRGGLVSAALIRQRLAMTPTLRKELRDLAAERLNSWENDTRPV